MEDKTFKDLTKFAVVRFGEETEEYFSADEDYVVYNLGECTWSGKAEKYIELLYVCEYGEVEPSLRPVSEEEFYRCGGTVVSIPDEKTQETIKSLDSLITSIEKQAEEIKSKAKESGLDYDVVVLSSPDDLGSWYSSSC